MPSLVGSEMCIRGRAEPARAVQHVQAGETRPDDHGVEAFRAAFGGRGGGGCHGARGISGSGAGAPVYSESRGLCNARPASSRLRRMGGGARGRVGGRGRRRKQSGAG